jgi:hypothetical protein
VCGPPNPCQMVLMRGLVGSILLVWTSLGGALAASQERPPEPWSVIRSGPIRAHVEFLANDLLEGRAAASRGHDLAATYVAAQFRQYGLKPTDNDSYFQSVPLLEATPVLPGSAAELVVAEQTYKFEYSTDYLPGADFQSASSTITAPTIFAGYGIEAPELRYDDFAALDLKGRIAVVFSGAPASFPNSQRAYYSRTATKFAALIARGAIGAVLVDSPSEARRVPWERTVSMSWVPQMLWLDSAGKPQDAFPELKLRFRFNQEAAARLFVGTSTSFPEVLAKAESGEAQGFDLPGMLTLSATTGLRRTESMNVLGILPGSDPKLRREFVVVTAHLDHLGRGAAVAGDSIYNGAHDNALGVGIMLEMARALSSTEPRPRRSILFAAVTAEEKGLLGSDYLAVNPPPNVELMIANINLDMPLLLTPTTDLVALGADQTSLGNNARTAALASGYRLSPDSTPEEVSFIRSDQFSFLRQGIPSIILKSGYQARDRSINVVELQREFRKNNYHQPNDNRDVPMDFAGAADLARINMRIALDVANANSRPRWRPSSFFGNRFARPR